MKHDLSGLLLVLFGLFIGQATPITDVFASDRVAKAILSKDEAVDRAKRVSEVAYDLSLKLNDKSEEYGGRVVIHFNHSGETKPLTVDFGADGKVLAINANGQDVSKIDYNGHFIILPASALVAGSNTVTVTFSHPFSHSGSGLYRFVDPEDKNVYTFTDFEPYNANEFFPCFDQPDLKAVYTLEVEVPEKWVVISTGLEQEAKKTGPGKRTWKFPPTAKISTYIFSMHAGPYYTWSGKAGKIPLRLLARQTYAKYVKADEWLRWTKLGLEFYQKYFDYEYPFKKYDQILVPDFNAGAMENAGAVTFSERMIQRGSSTNQEKERRANVILHEMAHMWFGDLVTMKWWNDLWLNESFATFMASLCMTEATEFKNAWQSFFASDKSGAYWEDQLVTTHPIEADVPDTDQAFTNFDNITYGKGASVLKQMYFYLGPDVFREGARNYFKRFAFSNTELADFMGSMAEAGKQDLKSWSDEWLKTAGVNTLEAKYDCKAGKIRNFSLQQDVASGVKVNRSHRTEIALFDVVNDKMKMRKSVQVNYKGRTTPVSDLNGEDCAAILALNYNDYDYVKVKLDDRTLQNLPSVLSKIPEMRLMFWESLWDRVRDGEYSVVSFAELILKNLGFETDEVTAAKVADKITGRRSNSASVLSYLPGNEDGSSDHEKAFRRDLVQRFEGFFWALLQNAKAGSDFQKLWFDQYVKVAQSGKALASLDKLLSKKLSLDGLEIDQDRRWTIISRLSAMGYSTTDSLLAAETKRDPSDQGKKMGLAVQVIKPSLDVKQKWFKEITSAETKMSMSQLRTAMMNLFPLNQVDLKRQFESNYYASLMELSQSKQPEFMTWYTSNLAPAFCDFASNRGLDQYLSKHSSLPAYVSKGLRVALDENKRCIKVRDQAVTEISETKRVIR